VGAFILFFYLSCLVLFLYFNVHPLGGLFLAHAEAGLHCTMQSITPPWAGCSGLMHLNHLGALWGMGRGNLLPLSSFEGYQWSPCCAHVHAYRVSESTWCMLLPEPIARVQLLVVKRKVPRESAPLRHRPRKPSSPTKAVIAHESRHRPQKHGKPRKGLDTGHTL